MAQFPVEIATDDGCYDMMRGTRRMSRSTSFRRVFPEALADMAAVVEAHTTLGLRDLSRMDFVVMRMGRWFITVAPGMTDPQAGGCTEDSFVCTAVPTR